MCLYITYRCNLRCQMCGIWKLPQADLDSELTVGRLAAILDDPLFRHIEFVNLNGGEPTLRSDLAEVADVLLDKLPGLRSLTLNTNGIATARCVELSRRILSRCERRRVRFGVSVSLHRVGPAYDEIAGVPDAYRKVMATLNDLKPLRNNGLFFLSTNCVLTPQSLPGAEDMVRWGIDEKIPVNFTVAESRERFNNLEQAAEITADSAEDRESLAAFLLRLSQDRGLAAHHALRYRELADMIGAGGRRRLACHYALAGLILGWDGSIYYCKKSAAVGDTRERAATDIYYDTANLAYRSGELLTGSCPTCLPNTFNRVELQKDLLKLIKLLR